MRRFLTFVLAVCVGALLCVTLGACGTMAGFGRDLTSAAEGIGGALSDQKQAMDETHPHRN